MATAIGSVLWGVVALVLLNFPVSAHFPRFHDDVFSATVKLENLLHAESKAINMLEDFVRNAEFRIGAIKRYLSEYRDFTLMRDDDASYVANPIHAYLLVKRLTVDWNQVENLVKTDINLTHDLADRLFRLRDVEAFPGEEDLHGAAVALVRLQDTYNLNLSAMVQGELRGLDGYMPVFHSAHQLTARDCLFLGKHSFNRGYYDKAILWFETAMTRADQENNVTTHREEIMPYLETAIRVHDEVLVERGPRGADWQTNPVPVVPKENLPLLASEDFKPKLFEYQSEHEELDHYNRLCRGEKLRTPKDEAALRCRLETRNHPYLILQPLYVEEMSLDPYIIVFRKLFSSGPMTRIIQVSKPKLQTSQHRNPNGGFQKSWKRTSQNAWVLEGEDPVVNDFNRIIRTSTGLHVTRRCDAEEYQVANYGIGGLYVPHTDYLSGDIGTLNTPWDTFVGDRVATFMAYLSDVEAGGATVFPRIGVTLWPEKGSAAFWWNLYKDGDGDELTRHGACPVLHGSKWVANKWIRHHSQMMYLPTSPDTNEKIQGLIKES